VVGAGDVGSVVFEAPVLVRSGRQAQVFRHKRLKRRRQVSIVRRIRRILRALFGSLGGPGRRLST
jgi:hypothetical protein